jgi:anthraniloyl-CoA monooxygenase
MLGGRLLRMIDYSKSRIGITDGTTVLSANGEGNGHRDDVALPLVTAPDTDSTSLDSGVRAVLDHLCARQPAAVVVRGGTALARVLCSEHIRLNHRIPTIVVDRPGNIRTRRAVDKRDCASTLILSGRADAVAFEPEPKATNNVVAHAEASR